MVTVRSAILIKLVPVEVVPVSGDDWDDAEGFGSIDETIPEDITILSQEELEDQTVGQEEEEETVESTAAPDHSDYTELDYARLGNENIVALSGVQTALFGLLIGFLCAIELLKIWIR